jgi:hypothetical protein
VGPPVVAIQAAATYIQSMARHVSSVFVSVGLMLLTGTALSMAQVPDPAEQTLPATDINRESNNPAKEAIKAKEAQD